MSLKLKQLKFEILKSLSIWKIKTIRLFLDDGFEAILLIINFENVIS